VETKVAMCIDMPPNLCTNKTRESMKTKQVEKFGKEDKGRCSIFVVQGLS